MSQRYQYTAFISYSNVDRSMGERFQKALESYRVPKPLRGQPTVWGPLSKRLTPIFRDRWDLEANRDLAQRIARALQDSAYLIVLCSPGKAFFDQKFDAAVVLWNIGYLQRNPDQAGYDFWLAKLKQYGNWMDASICESVHPLPGVPTRLLATVTVIQ